MHELDAAAGSSRASRSSACGWGVLAALTCPCHLPVLVLLLSGSAAGAFVSRHLGVTAVVLAALFVVSLTAALRAFRRQA